ncbi:hypothetical protein CFP56_019754 [Quercus suber]|uniref:Uncharacterized protein n=1 Tax=Quercus suber TaxID=58331 RepID=A0AAW0M0P1_QUESU
MGNQWIILLCSMFVICHESRRFAVQARYRQSEVHLGIADSPIEVHLGIADRKFIWVSLIGSSSGYRCTGQFSIFSVIFGISVLLLFLVVDHIYFLYRLTCLAAAKTAMFSTCQSQIGARAVLHDCNIRVADSQFKLGIANRKFISVSPILRSKFISVSPYRSVLHLLCDFRYCFRSQLVRCCRTSRVLHQHTKNYDYYTYHLILMHLPMVMLLET